MSIYNAYECQSCLHEWVNSRPTDCIECGGINVQLVVRDCFGNRSLTDVCSEVLMYRSALTVVCVACTKVHKYINDDFLCENCDPAQHRGQSEATQPSEEKPENREQGERDTAS